MSRCESKYYVARIEEQLGRQHPVLLPQIAFQLLQVLLLRLLLRSLSLILLHPTSTYNYLVFTTTYYYLRRLTTTYFDLILLITTYRSLTIAITTY